jgi:hypothetical protein
MRTRFHSYKELFDFARELRDSLVNKGKVKEAQELTELLDGYRTTASEALGDFLVSLKRVRNTVIKNFPDATVEKLDLAIQQIQEAFDQANNP